MLRNVKCLLSLSKVVVPAVIIALAASNTLAETYWTQDFDSLATGEIHGKGTTWEGNYRADVTASSYYSASHSLLLHEMGGSAWAKWSDDTPGTPHGSILEFSWMVNRSPDAIFHWKLWGLSGSQIGEIANDETGTPGTLDCLNGMDWVETFAIVPADTWSKFTMQVDLSGSEDQYSIRIGDGIWYGPYSLGTDEQYLRSIEFFESGRSSYLDDMVGKVIPEPAAFLLMMIGLTSVCCYRRR